MRRGLTRADLHLVHEHPILCGSRWLGYRLLAYGELGWDIMDAGQSTEGGPNDLTYNLANVSCTSASFCLGVGAEGAAVTWDGVSWSLAAGSPQTTLELSGISVSQRPPASSSVQETHRVLQH